MVDGGNVMDFYLIDDDSNVINILKLIIEDRHLGSVVGSSDNAEDALEDLEKVKADVIIVDLLMPRMDGITFVEKAKNRNRNTAFIMLSQVSSKDMIANAYEKGIDFFIQKPLNSIEIESVIKKVCENLTSARTLRKMKSLLQGDIDNVDKPTAAPDIISDIMHKLGIYGELGSNEVMSIIEFINKSEINMKEFTLDKICVELGKNSKSVEQRIRRTAAIGMANLASLGIEDSSNTVFNEYSTTLYNFEQVKNEMDYIRGKSNTHGKVNVKKFINGLIAYGKK